MMFILQLSFITTLLLLIIASIFRWLLITQKPKSNLPPSPPKLPLIGNFHQLGKNPHHSLQSLAKKHGHVMLLHFGQVPVLVIQSPDAAREILKTHDLIFSSRPKSTMASTLFYGGEDMAFSPYGEYWRQVKSITVLNLLSSKRVQSYNKVREEQTALMVEKIRNASNGNRLINMNELFKSLTNDVVFRVALGKKTYVGKNRERFKDLLGEVSELLGVFCIGDYVPWLWWVDRVSGSVGRAERVAKEIDEFLDYIINDHMEGKKDEFEGEGKTFLEILIEIQRENKLGFPISRDTIKALILDMFAAGTETTYTVLEWAMAELLKHPTIMIKLQTEVRQILKNKSKITEDDLNKMHFLKLVIKETLRLHTPIPLLVPHESTKDAKICGYDIKGGTQVIINAWAIGRDPSMWEDPEEFKPERFLNSCIDFKGFHFELIPFGAGRRGCPGIQFATAVNELALAVLLFNFDFALPDGERAEDLDMSECVGINSHKKSDILVFATPSRL